MGYIKGKDLRIKVGDAGILHAQTCTFSSTMNFENVVDKDTPGGGQFENFEPGTISFTLNHSGLLAIDGDLHAIITAYKAGTKLEWDFETSEAGSTKLSGDCYYAGVNIEAPTGSVSKLEIPLQGTGEFLSAVVV